MFFYILTQYLLESSAPQEPSPQGSRFASDLSYPVRILIEDAPRALVLISPNLGLLNRTRLEQPLKYRMLLSQLINPPTYTS